MATPSVKRTPTTESLVDLEKEKRAVYKTAVKKLFYMGQERADIMYSVKETARKILCSILDKCPDPAVREHVHRLRLGRTAHYMSPLPARAQAVELRSGEAREHSSQ